VNSNANYQRFNPCTNEVPSCFYPFDAPGQAQPKRPQKTSTRAPKATTSTHLNASSLYDVALSEKYEVLEAINENQFNNQVLNAMSDEDATETQYRILCWCFSKV